MASSTIRSVPSRIQDLIKLVKYWYKEFVLKGQEQYKHETVLNSIEKATVKAWRKRNSPKTINMAIAFMAVMEELRDHDQDCGASQAAIETMKKPMFDGVSVTKNLCRTPTVNIQSVLKTTPRAIPKAAISRPSGASKDERRSAYLDKFIAEQLQPDKDFHDLVSTALKNLYHYLQTHMQSPTVKCLIKGGSIGKGTALKGRSDLDCILVMNDIEDAPDLKEKISGILAQLRRLLNDDPLKQSGWEITIIRVNSFLVQIEMQLKQNESVEVDILPTFDADVDVEYSREQLYKSMARYDYDTQQLCSAALAKLKLDFIKPKKPKLKSLIRLVKHWCKTYLPGQNGQRMPNSYLLELLTISVWENAKSPDTLGTASLFKKVMSALCNHKQLDVKWKCCYKTSMIKVESIPRIVDPANPYNNVYDVVKGWKRVTRVARETLNKPLLKDL